MELSEVRKPIQIFVELYLVGFFTILFLLFFFTDFSVNSLDSAIKWPCSIFKESQSISFWFSINILFIFYSVYIVARVPASANRRFKIFKIAIRTILEFYSVAYFLILYISIIYIIADNSVSLNSILNISISNIAWIYHMAGHDENMRYFYLVFLSLFYIFYYAFNSKRNSKSKKKFQDLAPSQIKIDELENLSEDKSNYPSGDSSISEKEISFYKPYFILFDALSVIYIIPHLIFNFKELNSMTFIIMASILLFWFLILFSIWITKKILRHQLQHIIHQFQRVFDYIRSVHLRSGTFYFHNFRVFTRLITVMYLGIDTFFGIIYFFTILFNGDTFDITFIWWIISFIVSCMFIVLIPHSINNENKSEFFFFSFT